MKKKILVADDDENLINMVKDILEEENFEVTTASTTEEAGEKIASSLPDLLILDIKMPTIGGLEFCRILKENEKTHFLPVIMLTVQDRTIDKIIGLETGADDYITKPFNREEFLARVKAILRRKEYRKEKQKIIKFKDLVIDLEKFEVRINKNLISLTKKEFDLLYLLLKHKGKVLNKSFILSEIWTEKEDYSFRTIEVHISRVREKLGKYGNRIKSITGIGYTFSDE